MKVVALAGGTGSSKLLRGLSRLRVDLAAVVNVGDNAWMYGVYVCPDIDVATYALAGVANRQTGWGVEGDTFDVLRRLSKLGVATWFRLGDLDLATCLYRTHMMREGKTLTEATDEIRRAYGVGSEVLPVTDSEVQTWLTTSKGEMHLQEFWVREKGRLPVSRVRFRGVRKAKVTEEARGAISEADLIVLCPANPVTSLGPILAVPGMVPLLSKADARKVALSPMAGRRPFSGPAGKLLRSMGAKSDSVGVARLYSKFLDGILIAEEDFAMKPAIESLGVDCKVSDTFMRDSTDEVRLAKEVLEL